jgi:phosphate-selective porin
MFRSPLNAQEIADERIDKMYNTLSKLPKISGDVNVRYIYDDLPENNSFDVRRARLDFRGNVTNKIEYRIYLDFMSGAKLTDAYLTWKMTDYLSLQAGQYKIPFSLENPYNPNNLETIDNSLVVTNLVNYSGVYGIGASGRDVGIMLSGNLLPMDGFSIINYSAGLFNGAGINTADNNKPKDFSGMLAVNPLKHLSISASYYNGKMGPDTLTRSRIRTGFGAKYDDSRLLLRTEYIQGKMGSVKSDGLYAVAGYFVHPKIQPVLKYDYFRGNVDVDSTTQQDYVIGVNYLPVNSVRLQLNLTHRIDNGSNLIAAQVWLKF